MKSLLILAAVVVLSAVPARNHSWPAIEPFDRTFKFNNLSEMHLRFPIMDTDGNEAYFIACASPLADPKAIGEYAYSRDFECHVSLPGATTLPDIQLLSFNGNISKEWESRGGFWCSELVGACKSYPDWGSSRVYLFRGMRLTIALSEVNLKTVIRRSEHDPYYKLDGLKVRISGRVDPMADKPFGGYSQNQEPRPVKPSEPYGFLNCSLPKTPRQGSPRPASGVAK